MQAQIQALLAAGGVGTESATMGSNMGSHMEMAKPAIFNGEAGKVGVVATTCCNGTCSLLTSAKLSNGLSSSGGLQENSTRSPRCIAPLFI